MTSTSIRAPERDAPAFTPPRVGPVLVAITGSAPHDVQVLHAARLLAAHRVTDLAVVAVAEPLPAFVSGADLVVTLPPDDPAERRAELRASVQAVTRAVWGDTVRPAVEARYGDPAEQIVAAARAIDASLIVVGIGRHGPMDRLLGSETALRVVRLADRPVLAVAGRLETLPARVVVATDFSPSSAHAARAALPLVDPRAAITFVHAWRRVGMLSHAIAEAEAAYVASLPARFERFVDEVHVSTPMTAHVVSMEGHPVEQVLTFARDGAAQLIVVGRQHHAWVDRLVVGSVTTALLRGAPCAVLVTPDPGAGAAEGAVQLDGFTRRDQGRPVTTAEDDTALGVRHGRGTTPVTFRDA